MPSSPNDEMVRRFTQEALKTLEFPMAKPWPDIRVGEAPLDGRSLIFADDEMAAAVRSYACRMGKVPSLKALPRTFLVLVERGAAAVSKRRKFLNALTVFAVTAHELIRFQPVLVEPKFLRPIGGCLDGELFEVDEQNLTAWDGTPVPSSARLTA